MKESPEPTLEELEKMPGLVCVHFGASWCHICQGFAPELSRLLEKYPSVSLLKIEDGKGKPLGRAFRVKLWPTLVFLSDGKVHKQLVRPSAQEAEEAFRSLVG